MKPGILRDARFLLSIKTLPETRYCVKFLSVPVSKRQTVQKRFLYIPVLSCIILWGCQPGPSAIPPPEKVQPASPTPFTSPHPSESITPVAAPSPAPSPVRKLTLLFHSDRDGDNEIYTLDLFTKTTRQLTDNEFSDSYPVWSPNKERILFVSDRDGNPEIYVMDSDGGNPIRLTDNQEPDSFPCWSPDGETIAFFSGREAADNLCLMKLSGNNRRFLTDFEEGRGGAAAFSADGEKIVFGYERLGKYKIYLVDLSGGEPREIINNAREESRISWAPQPDGQALFYVSGKGNQEDVWLFFVDDGRFKHITKNTAADRSPCLSPNGDEVIFCSLRDGEQWQLYIVSLEGEPTKNTVFRLTNDSSNYCYPDCE